MKYVYELIGTFFLVFTVGMTGFDSNVGLWAPLAIGSVLAVMVFAGGHVSGGHYNPAVSLAVFIRKKLSAKELILYWLAQFIAAIIAVCLIIYFKGERASAPLEISLVKALVAEFIFTFALCFVVLNVATAKETTGNSYFGWAIGFTVLVGAYAVGILSSAAFNPAVALGITILNLSYWSNLWIYLVANLLGAAAAGWLFNVAHPEAKKTNKKNRTA